MSKKIGWLMAISAVLTAGLTIGGCSPLPMDTMQAKQAMQATQAPGPADRQPQISFKATTERVLDAKIILDGIDRGQVGSYLEGDTSLLTNTGAHMLIVAANNRLIYQQSFDADKGYSRVFTVY
jgi:hypothetical protein